MWLRQDARIDVAAGADGQGALQATAASVGIARREHYVRLERNGRIEGEGRIAEATDITIRLTDDDARVRMLELRGNSRITGTTASAQAMSARDIDMTYAEDGRTLQATRLVENAVVQLPGAGAAPGKRIAASTIDMTMGPDGSTLTGLAANEGVQVDIPPEGSAPAKQIRSATLNGAGAEGGLRNATFAGGVTYAETRAARRNLPALDRTARSQTLAIDTEPGLGAIQKADFRGNVHFTDGADFVADAQRGVYDIAADRLDLMPQEGLPGPASPSVTDGNVTVAARTIQFGLSSRVMSAETRVGSTIQPQKNRKSAGQGRVPSVLSQDEPVNVTSDRLSYKGRDSAAVYTGNVTLWQGADTTIKGPTLTIDDKSGNLTATGGVTTSFMIRDAADKKAEPGKRKATIGSAESFTYDDAKRLATYTGKANLRGPQGDVTGEGSNCFSRPRRTS
jgi:lipopolysaccharide transport protein LptA